MARAFAAAAAPVLAALLAALPAAGAQAPPRTAGLKLASLAPLAVTGRNFGARETVLLIYHGPNGSSKLVSVRATKLGRFRGAFRLRVARCDSFTVRAVGTAGSRAILQVERSCEEKGPPEQAPKDKPKRPGG
jgi:hypothetical protein